MHGSVHVPVLMNVETYATVHQLVSTVRGRLLPHLRATDVLLHSFPPGSMTGAPKIRSCRILQQLEEEGAEEGAEENAKKRDDGVEERSEGSRERAKKVGENVEAKTKGGAQASGGGRDLSSGVPVEQLHNEEPKSRRCARGIYSGCLGFFALSGGADFNVVIRTAVCTTPVPRPPQPQEPNEPPPALHQPSPPSAPCAVSHDITVGVGGAIVYLSDPASEHSEILLKGRALMRAIQESAH